MVSIDAIDVSNYVMRRDDIMRNNFIYPVGSRTPVQEFSISVPVTTSPSIPYLSSYEVRSLLGMDIKIKEVIYHEPATIVYWSDNTKTVVKCQEGDTYNKELGLALCCAKKLLGNKSNFNNAFKKWVK